MKKLAQRQINRKIESIQLLKKSVAGVPSWVRYMRNALGMTSKQLASRMGVAVSSLNQLERQEIDDKASLQSLKKAANAMECDLIYAFVPRRPLQEIVDDQAYKRAKQIVKSSHLHMEYEDQAVSKADLKEQVDELIETLKKSKKLWNDE